MNKQEMIDKYGIEWYEARKAKNNERNKLRYKNNSEYRAKQRAYIKNYYDRRYNNDPEYRDKLLSEQRDRYNNNELFRQYMADYRFIYRKAKYVKDGRFDLVDNYELAKSEEFKGWDLHHRDEIRVLPSGMIAIRTMDDLKEAGRYYDCPPNELLWIRHDEHTKYHSKYKKLCK